MFLRQGTCRNHMMGILIFRSVSGQEEQAWNQPISLSIRLRPSPMGETKISPSSRWLRQKPHSPLRQWVSMAIPARSSATATGSEAAASMTSSWMPRRTVILKVLVSVPFG